MVLAVRQLWSLLDAKERQYVFGTVISENPASIRCAQLQIEWIQEFIAVLRLKGSPTQDRDQVVSRDWFHALRPETKVYILQTVPEFKFPERAAYFSRSLSADT